MRILRLRTANFRSLPDQQWEFHPDFQVIAGPNEAGKSSILEALLVGLYGDAASLDSRFARDRRWKSKEHITVALDLDLNGEMVTIERDFENRKNRLTVADKKLTSKEKIHAWLHDHLPIQSESAFLETACARQSEVRSDIRSSDLGNQIERHALSATGNDLKHLYESLGNEVNELRRGWQTSAPKNPGPIKRLDDEISRLQAELADLDLKEEASAAALDEYERLNRLVTEINAECKQEEERLKLDEKYLDAERVYQERKREIVELQKKLQRLTEIPAAIQKAIQEHSEAQILLADSTSRHQKALAWKQASANLQQIDLTLSSLTSDIAALQECTVALGQLRNPLQGTTITLQDFPLFQTLTRQTQQLQQEMLRDSAEVSQLEKNIAGARARIDETSKECSEREVRIRTIEAERVNAAKREELTAGLAKLAERDSAISGQLLRIRNLQTKRIEIEEALSPLEMLGRIDMEAFQRTASAIPDLEKALRSEGIGLELDPEHSLSVTVQVDKGDEQTLNVTETRNWAGIKEIRIHIPGIGHLRVTNQSSIARQLDARRDEVTKTLAEMAAPTMEAAFTRHRSRNDLLAQRAVNGAELRAAIQGKTMSDWEKESQAIRDEGERLNRELQGVASSRALALIDFELVNERERLNQLKTAITESQTLFSVLGQQLYSAQGRSKRCSDELSAIEANRNGILRASGQATESGLQKLQDELSSFQAQVAELEHKRAKVLRGRLEQDIVSAHSEERRKRQEMDLSLTELTPFASDEKRLSQLSLEIQRLGDLVKGKSDQVIRMKRELELLELERLEERHSECAAQAAIADVNRKSFERYTFPDPNDRLAHSSRLETKLADLAHKRESRAESKVKAESFGANRDRIVTLTETLAQTKAQLHQLKHQFEIDSMVLDFMAKAREKALADLLAAIPSQVATTLSRITSGKYTRVLGAGFDLKPWSEQKEDALENGEVSTGTLDQFYLTIRLEALRVTFPKDLPPFILDDVLVSSDPNRRSKLVQVLEEYTPHGQVLYLTCHDWPELKKFHLLKL